MVNPHHPGLRGDSALRHTITPPLATSLHALGAAGSLCESREVAQASGIGALGELLSAIESVAKCEGAKIDTNMQDSMKIQKTNSGNWVN